MREARRLTFGLLVPYLVTYPSTLLIGPAGALGFFGRLGRRLVQGLNVYLFAELTTR